MILEGITIEGGIKISDAPLTTPMVLKFNIIAAPTNTLRVRLGDPGYNIYAVVDWDDGTAPEIFTTSGEKTRVVNVTKMYNVTVDGIFPHYGGANAFSLSDYTLEEIDLGNLPYTTNWSNAFSRQDNLKVVNGNIPINTTNTSSMFANVTNQFSFPKITITNIGNWDVGNVSNMVAMFNNTTFFNQDLTGWCVTNIPTEPTNFATGSALTSNNKPIWGTCP